MHERSSPALDAIIALPGAARVVPYGSVLATYLASRLLMAVVAAFAALARPDLTFRDTITIWDGLWYRLAAETDYPAKLKVPGVLSGATSSSFFPGYRCSCGPPTECCRSTWSGPDCWCRSCAGRPLSA